MAKKYEVFMKLFKKFVFVFILALCNLFAQGIIEYNTREEAERKLYEMIPKENEFLFKIPDGWQSISLSSANIITVNNGEDKNEAQKIIDGKTSTSWKTNSFYTKPEVVIDLGSNQKFDKIILYNRQTTNRGSGGGNNALKTVEISCSNDINSSYKKLCKYELHGPKAACFKVKGEGGFCTFIDDPEPNIIEIPSTDARYLKMSFIDAFWENDIPHDWRDSFSLTEVMLFKK
jgi:hypothetical protein